MLLRLGKLLGLGYSELVRESVASEPIVADRKHGNSKCRAEDEERAKEMGRAAALHIYLPDSQTTIVYLNLDTKLFDFKFWMLHELGHVKTRGLLDPAATEAFADSFAYAPLVPKAIAEAGYQALAPICDI